MTSKAHPTATRVAFTVAVSLQQVWVRVMCVPALLLLFSWLCSWFHACVICLPLVDMLHSYSKCPTSFTKWSTWTLSVSAWYILGCKLHCHSGFILTRKCGLVFEVRNFWPSSVKKSFCGFLHMLAHQFGLDCQLSVICNSIMKSWPILFILLSARFVLLSVPSDPLCG